MRVLFVCTGNTCRSPMAEGLLRKIAAEEGLEIEVKSAGVAATPGTAFARHARTVLEEKDASFKGKATWLDDPLLTWADLVLVMTNAHKVVLLERYPAYVDKVYLLKEYVEMRGEIADKLRQLDELYAAAELKRAQFFAENKRHLEQLERQFKQQQAKSGEQLENNPSNDRVGNQTDDDAEPHASDQLDAPTGESFERQLARWRERLYELTRPEEEKIRQIERELPDFDIVDPFGGTLDEYRACGEQLESLLRRFARQLKNDAI